MLKERDERGGYIVPTRTETTLQRLNRCRAVLRMHGVLSNAENLRILKRIVATCGDPDALRVASEEAAP